MTSPGSETAWHFSSSGTKPDDNQIMNCSSVPSAWLAKVPNRILHVAPLRSASLNAFFPNPYDWFLHCNGKNLHPLATRFRRFLLEASLLGPLHWWWTTKDGTMASFFPLQGLLILAYHQHFTFKDKSAFNMNKKTRIGTKNHFGDGSLNLT